MTEDKIIMNAGTVILQEKKVLLVQEAKLPFKGKWNFPIGGMESDEKLPQTAVREALEETGLNIELVNFLGIYQNLPVPGMNIVLVMFVGKVIGGELITGNDEILQVKWFSIDELEKLSDEELFHPEMRNAVRKALTNPQSLNNYVNF